MVLMATLAGEGVYVSEMTPIQTSLERYFLEVTGSDAAYAEEAAQ